MGCEPWDHGQKRGQHRGVSALSRNKEWEKIDSYLKNMEGIALDADGDMTGNKAVDALLYQKRKRADEKNIKWECDLQMPKGYSINEFDLCVLFGNILDNALEACGRMRCGESCFINIQTRTVKKCFLIEIKTVWIWRKRIQPGLRIKRIHGNMESVC